MKGILLLIIFAQIFIAFTKTNKIFLCKKLFVLFVFYIFLGLFYGAYGFARGNPGTAEITKEVVLYVIFAMVLITGIRNKRHIEKIHKTLVFSTLFLTLYIIITILNANGIWPDWLYTNLSGAHASQSVAIGSLLTRGRIDVGFSSLPSFLFLQPYLFCFALASNERPSKPLWAALLASTAFMIISGSRIIFLLGISMPAVIIIYMYLNKKKDIQSLKRIKSVILWLLLSSGFVLMVLIQLGFSIQALGWDFLRAFMPYELTNIFEGGSSASAYSNLQIIPNRRLTTFTHLFTAWLERPFFGAGSGAVYLGFIRSSVEPWKYELSFMQYLYNWGIFGCGLYLGGLWYIYIKLIKIFKQNHELGPIALATTFGSISFILGSVTNPFLLRFDSIFAVFLPIAILNIWMRNYKQKSRKNAPVYNSVGLG